MIHSLPFYFLTFKMKFFRYQYLFVVIVLSLVTNAGFAQGQQIGSEMDKVTIEYIGHASFKISTSEHAILLDPFANKVWIGYNFPSEIEADAIFSTHPHYDHDGGIFINRQPYWKDKIALYQDPGLYEIGNIKVNGIAGKHSDPYGKEFGQKNTIWIINVGGLKIAHLGDNGPLFAENIEALQNLDILMVPIDAEYHILKKEQLAELLDQLKPRIIIPMHYKIEGLENQEGKPKDLGPIGPYLVGKKNVVILPTNYYSFTKPSQPKYQQIIVFKHSPKLTNN